MWRDRLRAALATPVGAKYASAVSAVSAVSPPGRGADEQTAETAETALEYLGQIDPGCAARTAELSAYCDARAADLVGVFDDPEVLADRAAIAAEPLLAETGTIDRARLDREHAATLAGLRAAAAEPTTRAGRARG